MDEPYVNPECRMKRILILAPNKPFLGAQIVQLPLLSELRARNPECRTMLALPFAGPSVFGEFHFHDELVDGWAESATRTLRFLSMCASRRFDEVYSLRARSTRTGLAALISGARRRTGFAVSGNGGFFNCRIRPREDVYLALKYLDLLGKDGPAEGIPPVTLWTDEHALMVTRVFVERGIRAPFVGIIAGAGGEKKRYPGGKFIDLAERIRFAFPEVTVVYFLSREDSAGDIGRALSSVDARRKFSFEGLRPLACAISKCDALISADCGPAHIGHLLGLRQLVLFDGTGRPREWFLPRAGASYLIAENDDAVSTLDVEAVFRAARKVIGFAGE